MGLDISMANAITTVTTGPTVALQLPAAQAPVLPLVCDCVAVLTGTSGALSVTYSIEKSDTGLGSWTTAVAANTISAVSGVTTVTMPMQCKFEGSYFRVNVSAISGTGAAFTFLVNAC
jgi:hypothetical protein